MVIGLTGYTGAGKSVVAQIFASMGAYTIDTDQIARGIVEPGQTALEEIRSAFGESVIAQDGTLRRSALADLVFQDEQKRKRLEAITHPAITDQVKRELRTCGAQLAVIDAPVLFNVPEIASLCDAVIFVDADKKLRTERIMNRDGLTQKRAQQRVDAQAFMESWKKQCDFVLVNNGNLEEIREKVWEWMEVQGGSRR